jgi:hypothetical protein
MHAGEGDVGAIADFCTSITGLEVTVKDNSGEVGPIALQLSSPHLTVASLCFLNITFESPPDMEILSVGAVSSAASVEGEAPFALLAEVAGAFPAERSLR